jgi:hypothetical protein
VQVITPGPVSYQACSTGRSGNRPTSRRIASSSLKIRSVTGLSSPGNSVATTIVFFEVSVPRWVSPDGDATLDMTAGSLPP